MTAGSEPNWLPNIDKRRPATTEGGEDEGAKAGDGWQTPLPIGWQAGLPAFPTHVLPPILRDYVVELSAQIQTPQDMAATAVLGVVSAAIGGRIRIEARPGWSEPSNLYVVVVARPASRKSEVIKQCRRPLARAEKRLREAYGEEIANDATKREILDGRAEKLKKAAMTSDDPEAIEAAQEAVRVAEQVNVRASPRLWTSDATPEALETLMAEQGGRIAGISAEAGLFDSFAGRHAKKTNIELLLEAHAGDERASDRQTRRGAHMESPCLTIIVSIQPFALHQLVDNAEYGGRGLLARMMWSLTPDNVGTRSWEAPEAQAAVVAAYETRVADIAVAMYGRNEVLTLHLDDAAAKRLGEYYEQVEKLMHPEGAHGDGLIRDWVGKLVGAAVRIAAGLHVVQHPPGLDPADRPTAWTPPLVDEHTMDAAIQIAEYYRAHADAALAPRESQAAADARALLEWLAGRDATASTFTARDVQRGGPRRFRKDGQLVRKTINSLSELGWCREQPEGGWSLHPEAKQLLQRPNDAEACDTCDSGDETAGHSDDCPNRTPSHGVATGGDGVRRGEQPVARVARGRHAVRQGAGNQKTTVTSGNAQPVARVARPGGFARSDALTEEDGS